jgi:phosphatidylglycerol lysyltransferase
LIDTGFAALALWFLLPEGAPPFLTFLPVFAAAMMAGVVSHVPGGIGVFESVILAAMPPDVPKTEVAAALLLFRGIYYLLPFALAVAVVALNEARLAGGLVTRLLGEVPAPLRPVFDGLRVLIPMLVGAVSLAAGGYLLLVALMPSVRPHSIDPGELFGAILLEGGAALSAMIGVLLLLLSQGLVRRISGSFWLLQAALLTGAVASALNDLDLESAALLLAIAGVLWPFRREFHRTAKLTRGVLSPIWFALVLGIALSCVAFFLLMHEATPWSGALWTEFTVRSSTPRALRAGMLATALLLVGLVWIALQPVRARTLRPDPASLETARAIVRAQDRPEACLALSGDKALFLAETDDALIAYAVQGKSWIAQGDPVGPAERVKDLVWDFVDAARAGNCRPAFYSVSDRYLGVLVEIGFTLHKLGEEAVVPLPGFSLAGGRFKTMRAAHNKAQKSGLVLELHEVPHDPALLAEMKHVSDAWLRGKTGSEKGFSVGRFTESFLDEGPVATVRRDGRMLAFATILRPGDGAHLAVDLMRYLPEAASGMMEFLFLGLIEHFRDAGAQTLSLGVAPLAGIHVRPGSRLWTRIGAMVFRHGGAFYNFEGLRAFKEKFQPDWQPRFLAVAGGASPLLVLKDAAVLIAGGMQGLTPRKSRGARNGTSIGGD